jgi:hypothetical protein
LYGTRWQHAGEKIASLLSLLKRKITKITFCIASMASRADIVRQEIENKKKGHSGS